MATLQIPYVSTAVQGHSRILLRESRQSQRETTGKGSCSGLVKVQSVPQGRC